MLMTWHDNDFERLWAQHSMVKEFGAGTHLVFEHSDGATGDFVERMSFCIEQ